MKKKELNIHQRDSSIVGVVEEKINTLVLSIPRENWLYLSIVCPQLPVTTSNDPPRSISAPRSVCYILDIHLLESFYQESHDQESHNQEHVISEIEMYMEFMKFYILSI